MSDRAALYTVAVRSRRGGPAPLDDIDGAGSALGDVLAGILDGFSVTSPDGSRLARTHEVSTDGDDVFAIVQHGRRGVAADIVTPGGRVRLRQTPDDLQLVRCGCLFRLPRRVTQGLLAVQVTYGQGVKGLFEQGLTSGFRQHFPSLTLALDRQVDPDVLRRAVADGRVERIRLVRTEAAARDDPDLEKWVAGGVSARIEVDVGAAGVGQALLGRFLAGDGAALSAIVEFGGVTYDRAHAAVRLPDGSHRLVDLAHPDRGVPASRGLDGLVRDRTGEPTSSSLLAALREAVTQGSAALA